MRPKLLRGSLLASLTMAAIWLVVESRSEHWFPDHFNIVVPQIFYRSGQLTPDQFGDLVLRHQIRTVVNLQRAGRTEEVERALADEYSVEYVHMPMPGDGFGRVDQFRRILDLIDDPDAAPILVHCARGTNRTGAAVALYRFERCGWTIDDVNRELRRQGYRDDWLAGYVYQMVDRQPYRALYGPQPTPDPVADVSTDLDDDPAEAEADGGRDDG